MSDPRTWDVVVVGAGPAGSSAAREAAAAGARVLLVERSPWPRYKRCGGGLIGRSQDLLRAIGVHPEDLAADTCATMTFSQAGQRPFTRIAPRPFLPLVMRSALDAKLVEVAVDAGVTFESGLAVLSYEEDVAGLRLGTSRGVLRADTVVCADGSQGRGSRYVGVSFQQVDLGLEVEIPLEQEQEQAWARRVHLDWGPVAGSYGWVFPKGSSLTVGVIGDRSRGSDLPQYLGDFMSGLGLDVERGQKAGGHMTRVRTSDSPLRRGRVLVAGDAAGLLEPWTREGISFALASGQLAGRAVVSNLDDYEVSVRRHLMPEMHAGAALLQAFRRHPGMAHLALRRLPGTWETFVDVVSGRSSLAQQAERRMLRGAVRQLGRGAALPSPGVSRPRDEVGERV